MMSAADDALRAAGAPTAGNSPRQPGVDLVCLGRVAVDLYGEQDHTPLTETRSFARYPGGSSGNLAIGAARLGLTTAMITTVGADPMGDYLLKQLGEEGVRTDAVRRDPDRRTALAFLGMLDAEAVNLDFYRQSPADEAIRDDQVPPGFLEGAAALGVTGTLAAVLHASGDIDRIVDRALRAGAKLIVDIDLRDAIWKAVAGGMAAAVERVHRLAAKADLVVGNEDEFRALAGVEGLDEAVEILRRKIEAPLVLKLGRNGAALIGPDGAPAPKGLDIVPGFDVECVNPVGAGDAFLAGFLASWLKGDPPETALRRANACGAIVVSRRGCSRATPFKDELDMFLESRDAKETGHVHRALSRHDRNLPILALACDHREYFQELMGAFGRDERDVRHFKSLVADTVFWVASDMSNAVPGILLDDRFGHDLIGRSEMRSLWLGRPVEVDGSRPLEFEDDTLEALRNWAPHHVAKCLIWFHPDDSGELKTLQLRRLKRLQEACRAAELEWMLEAVPPLNSARDDAMLLRIMEEIYDAGLRPDWWKLPAFQKEAGWRRAGELLVARDPYCRGIVILGLNETFEQLRELIVRAGRSPVCVGFAIGRTLFAEAARLWFERRIGDEEAVDMMSESYAAAISAFAQEPAAQD